MLFKRLLASSRISIFHIALCMIILFVIYLCIGGTLHRSVNRTPLRSVPKSESTIQEETLDDEDVEASVTSQPWYQRVFLLGKEGLFGEDNDNDDIIDNAIDDNEDDEELEEEGDFEEADDLTKENVLEEPIVDGADTGNAANEPGDGETNDGNVAAEKDLSSNQGKTIQLPDFSLIQGNADWHSEPKSPETRFLDRQQTMEERCLTANTKRQSYGIIRTNKIGIFFKQKASACLVNKAGSTTWRTHLLRVNAGGSIYQQRDRRWKAFMSQPNLPKAMSETSRIITVRHPLTRLVSAYRQRFGNGKIPSLGVWRKRVRQAKKYFSNYWLPAVISNDLIPAEVRAKMGFPAKHQVGKIYSTTLLKAMHQKLGGGFQFTYSMFLKHIIFTSKTNTVDTHWKPIDSLCSPCLLHYNYIVKVESMTEDVRYVFEELNIPSKPEIKKNEERHVVSPWKDMDRYINVSDDLKKEIIRIYWNDFYLFGYKIPPGFLHNP